MAADKVWKNSQNDKVKNHFEYYRFETFSNNLTFVLIHSLEGATVSVL